MKLLLDSHTFLWLAEDSHKLSSTVTILLNNDDNNLFISIASIWEMQLKNLSLHHKYPFDRMIICQAITENLPVLIIDNTFNQYPINTIW